MTEYKGRVWKFGDDVDTDIIIPARHLVTTDPAELAKHCMEDGDATFATRVQPGEIMVAGKNFGCGSSREHAPIALKACGISCVIAGSFARIFYRNAINIGLPIFESPEASAAISDGHIVSVDAASGAIHDETTGATYQAAAFPEFMQELMAAGGLVAYTRKRIGTGLARTAEVEDI